jgi:2-keto-3-deoxy-L-rhamnonate aldolase RhmA
MVETSPPNPTPGIWHRLDLFLARLRPHREPLSLVVDARVIAACRRHGKFPGMGGMYTSELLERYVGMGVQLVLAGSDFSLLQQAGQARASLVRSYQKSYPMA